MKTASDQAPAARGSLGRGADSPTRKRRISLGLTLGELAAEVGLSEAVLARIETGKGRPSLARAEAIAETLGVEVEDVFELRECACGCGGRMIDLPRDGSAPRYISGHNSREPDHGASIAEAHRARRRLQGIPEEKICNGCGRTYTRSEVPRQRLEHWLAREYCPDGCRWPVVDPRPCKYCGEMFRPDENRHEYCSGSHAQLARWKRLTDIPDAMLAALPPKARQVWFGRKKGREAGHLGGRPAAALTDIQRAEVEKLHARGWGRRAIANHLVVSERAVRNALDA
jgi:transcriptional regulator with XRE-family HTH domain